MNRERNGKKRYKKQIGLTLLLGLCLAAAGCGTAGGDAEAEESGPDPSGDTEAEEAMAELVEEAEPEKEAGTKEEEPAPVAASDEEAEPEKEAGSDEEPEPEPESEPEEPEPEPESEPEEPEPDPEPEEYESSLPGAALNGTQFTEGDDPRRVTYADGFYYEPISDALLNYITGTSYPETSDGEYIGITPDDLRYVHVLHYDFDGEPAEGELICNAALAQDLVEIFCELYDNEYQIEQIRLVDEYGGDDVASMAANNTSCFNYRNVPGSSSLSNHALGRALDINPLYNPYITYNSDGSANCSPEEGWAYADRSADFAHKIDTSDLCYQLFTAHGFTWGGSWNSSKDYQHFEKG